MTPRKHSYVFITQVYVPDPNATGQHLADVAEELARRGHDVTVYTSNRGYDEPSNYYPAKETRAGVRIRRVPFSHFGKSSIGVRIAGGLSFVAQSVARAIVRRHVDAVIVSTSPPMAPFAAITLNALRRARVKYWIMDINPDQIVALGMASPTSPAVRAFNWLNRRILGAAEDVVVLDRMMAERINRKRNVRDKLTILPPWPAHDPAPLVSHSENPFRRRYARDDQRIVMYSGNHGPSSPLTTILEAAKRLRDDQRLVFMFIGGGLGKQEVEEAAGPNVISLPYQPRSELLHSLSAADVHVVTVGDAVPGIVHPSKVYGAMSVGRPILLVGPPENHVADIMAEHDIGWHILNGDVESAVVLLREIATMPSAALEEKGLRAYDAIVARGGRAAAIARVADVIERNAEF
ncbi:MAG TPA: glycosyltransferase family 4 protein [Gemmatimonadaceae bacterium]|nr:glycosyltransferase family 4 protein [Gemmatimonadaceae bacterium]